jgi:hypothetical protein
VGAARSVVGKPDLVGLFGWVGAGGELVGDGFFFFQDLVILEL